MKRIKVGHTINEVFVCRLFRSLCFLKNRGLTKSLFYNFFKLKKNILFLQYNQFGRINYSSPTFVNFFSILFTSTF